MPFSHDLISSFRGGDQGIFVTKIMGYYWWIQRRNGNHGRLGLHSSFMEQGSL
jgi:hypothetical protein